jgi:hypothetical protein
MDNVIILSILVFYESLNFYQFYSIAPFMTSYDISGYYVNFIFFLMFALGQLIGYYLWYSIRTQMEIIKLISFQLFMCFLVHLYLIFCTNIFMLFVHRFAIGCFSTFAIISQVYVEEKINNTSNLRKKIYIVVFIIFWNLGQIAAIYIGKNTSIIGENKFSFINFGCFYSGITLVIFIFSRLLSLDFNVEIIENNDKMTINIDIQDSDLLNDRVAEPSYMTRTTHIEFTEIISDTENNYLIISMALMGAIEVVYIDMLKLFLIEENGNFAQKFGLSDISNFITIILVANTVIVFLFSFADYGNVSKYFHVYMIIISIIMVVSFPFFLLISIENINKYVVIGILNSIILAIFGILRYVFIGNMYKLYNTGKMAITYVLSKNISLIIGIVIEILLIIILNYTSLYNEAKYIIDTNSIFYVFGIISILPIITYSAYLSYNNE